MNRYLSSVAILCLIFLVPGAWAGPSFMPRSYEPMTLQVVEAGPAVQGVPVPPGFGWYSFANHNHTVYSDGNGTVAQLIQRAADVGADAVSILDHRTQEACSDPNFSPIGGCVPMCGEEWGWNGHLGMLNMAPGDPMASWSLEQAIPEALSRGATLVVHHPKTLGGDPWPYNDLHLGILGIEVWNSPSYLFGSGSEAVAWWDSLLRKGRIIFALGGSDMHSLSGNPLTPCNYVLASSPDPDALQQALEAGRIAILADNNAAKCLLWCDADDDGEFEIPMGASVPVTGSRMLRFRIEVYEGQGHALSILTSTGQVNTLTVGEGNPWHADIETAAGAGTKDFLRVEIPDPEDVLNPMDCVTNPIYVNYTAGDADSDGLSDVLEQQFAINMYTQDSDADGVSDDFEAGYDGNAAVYNPYNPLSNPSGTDMDALYDDTDYDGSKDFDELKLGPDPLDASSYPALPVTLNTCLALFFVLLATGGTLLVPSRKRY